MSAFRSAGPHLLTLLLVSAVAAVARAQATKDYGDVTRATTVTLKFDKAPQKDVFDQLARQAGQEFVTQPKDLWTASPGAPISIDLKDQPFWVAMKEACGKAGISLKYATDTANPQVVLCRDNQDWTKYPTLASGPFLVSLIGLERQSIVDMRKPNDAQRTFFARFSVFCEPRFRLLRGSLSAKVEQAVDDKGNSLVPKEAAADARLNFVTSWVYPIQANLEYPKDGAAAAGTRITTLRASARFVAQTKSQTIEIPDPLTARNVTRDVAGRKIVLKELRRTTEQYEATVSFARGESIPREQWENTTFPGNALRLVDADGKTIFSHAFGLGGRSDESTYVFKFPREAPGVSRIGKPVKLIWEIPTQTTDLPLTFEFKDLPVP
ncbi:MAG TPA: hypothetical protein VH475_15200 [Tepidisphaeraceae bacterium]|jgi:hypothetical protein